MTNIHHTAKAMQSVAGIADARFLYVTYTGTVTSGYDKTGLFGKANSKLNGDAFTITYKFDADLGRKSYVPSKDIQYGGIDYSLYGGSYDKTTSPLVGATITIDGHSRTMEAGSSAETTLSLQGKPSGGYSYEEDQDLCDDVWSNANTEITDSLDTAIFGNSLNSGTSFHETDGPSGLTLVKSIGAQDHPYGFFNFGTYDNATSDVLVDTFANLKLSTVSLSFGET